MPTWTELTKNTSNINFSLLTEAGDYLLLETGDKILKEQEEAGWEELIKNSATFSNIAKNSATFSNLTKN